ncbi:hypothetical protein EMPS_06647 [Entomortierella parvispora]|uniref:Uncharacterized protein n=1 Tax=Entomortierella parvispora TaxID=205924 RepID=A0A9P3LXM0_9FUNG|nr:hypothetical protein EMPS_06647 [Entomortierella parvispora]
MRISTFVPAVLGLSLFAASAQAGPIAKRENRNTVDLVIPKVIVDAKVNAVAHACLKLEQDLCLDVKLDLWADAQVLGKVVDAEADVDGLKLSVKEKLDAEVKAVVEADVKAEVLAKVDVHIKKILLELCPVVSDDCLKEHAHSIVAKVHAAVKVIIPEVKAKVTAHLESKLRLRLKAVIRKINVDALGLAQAHIKATLQVASNINIRLDAFVEVFAKVFANVFIPKLNLGAL